MKKCYKASEVLLLSKQVSYVLKGYFPSLQHAWERFQSSSVFDRQVTATLNMISMKIIGRVDYKMKLGDII